MAEQWGSNDKVVDSSGGFGADDEIDQHNPLRRGWNKMTQSVGITGALATGDYKGGAQKIAEADTYQKQNPGTPEGRELMQAWERGDGISGGLQEVGKKFSKDWNESKSGFGAIRSVAKNLQAMGSGVLEQTPNMVAPMGLQLAGGAAGAAAGSTIPVVGTVAGGIAGALVGSSLGNTAVEGGHMTQEALQKAGVNPQDKQATEKYLSQNGDKLLGQAGVKGSIIGAVDTATMKLGHGLLTAPADAAAKRAITSLGLDAADSAAIKAASGEISKRMAADPIYKAAKSGTGGLARNAGVAALEPAGEFTGEYVGQGVATGDWNEKNAFLEAASSIGQGAATFAGQKAYAGMKSPFGKADEVVPGTPPAKQPPAPPLQIGNTPDPYISFPDGTVASRSEADAYVNSLPADQQPAARAKLMGLAPQPAKPSEQMGLTPTAGPSLTNAAITAVDSGAAQVNIDQAPAEQTDIVEQQRQQYQQETAALLAQQDQEAFDAYLAAIEDANTALDEAPGESVQALSQLDDISVPDIFDANSNTSDADFLRAMGATEQEIADAITNQPGSPQAGTPNPVGTAQDEPGSTGQGVSADQTKQANLERIRKANNVSPPDSVQPIPATSSGQDGNQPAASVGLGSTDGNGLGANAAGSESGAVGQSGEQASGALRTPVAQGRQQPTTLGTQTSANAGPGFSAKDVQGVKNQSPAATDPQAGQAPVEAPQAVAGDAAPSGGVPAAGGAAVEGDGVAQEPLPPTDIRIGDAVIVDGKPYRVAQGIDGGIAVKSESVDIGNGVSVEKTKFLKGDDAIRAKIAADKAGLNSQPAQPVTGEGAGVSQPTQGAKPGKAGPASLGSAKADMDYLFGIDQKRTKALDRIAAGKASWTKPLDAQEFITKNGLKDTHQSVKEGGKWHVRAKAVSQPTKSTNEKATEAQPQQAKPKAGTTAGVQQPTASSAVAGEAEGVSRSILNTNGPHFASGVSDFKAGKPRVLPSYFTKATGKNPKDWYRGWDAANAAAPVASSSPEAVSAQGEGLNDHIRALRAVAHNGIKQGGPKGDVRLNMRGSNLYVPFDVAVAEARKAVAAGMKPVPFQVSSTLDIGIGETDRVIAALSKPQIVVDKAEMRPYRKPDGSVGYEAVPIVEDKQETEPKVSLKDKVPGDTLLMGNGNTYSIDGIDATKNKIRTLRNPGLLSERSVLLGQAEYDKLLADDKETRGGQNDELDAEMQSYEAKPALLAKLKDNLESLANRAGDAQQGALEGRIRGLTVGMKNTDSNLTPQWVNDVVAGYEKQVSKAERKQPPATAEPTPAATESVAKPAQTVESVARAVRQKIAANRRKAREKSRKEYEAKGWKPNSTPESEQADYDTEVNAKLSEYSEKYAAALLGDNPLPLIEMFVNGNFEASEDVFKDITGVKIRGLSAADKKAALYKWAKWTPEQIAKAESDAKERTDRAAEKNKQEDAKTRVMGEWLALSRLQIGEPGQKGMDGQEFVLQAVAKGYDKAHSQKKGIATIYGLTNGKEFTTLKKGAFTDFVKAAIAFGGLDKTLEYVNPPMPQKPAGFVDRSIETGKDAGMIAKAFAPTESETKPTPALAEPTPAATENVAKPDAKAVLSEREKAAKAKMFNALGKLATLAGKNTRMNWTQEEEQQLLPIVIELFDGAMELGAVTFQQAVAYVREFISSNLDQDTADSIPFDTLQGAYISVAGRHKDKPVTSKKEVVSFESLAELENSGEQADTSVKDEPVTAEDTPKESLLGANDDTRRNATNDSEPLDQALPGSDSENGTRGSIETGAGLRPTDAQGNGRPESGGSGRGNSLDGSKKPVLPSTPAEIRPLADGPVGKTEDRPQQLSGENPGNFVITDEFKLGQGTDGDKISGNLAAIRTLRQVQKENRYPTKAEQAIMARYVGWGGLKTVFDPKKADATDQYGKAQRELKSLLSPDEYRAANGSIRNAHYTAEGIVDGMWRVMRFMGFKGGRALEPTIGIGNFVGRMPADMAASTEWHASELDTTTGQLAAMLYPEANILASTGFQDAPFADGAFDISVGNPPFGSQQILDKSPNRKHLNGQKIHNYIIAKTGMHLRPGGVMSMVVTHRFLDTANPEARDVLAKDFRFLGAFRLPNDAFKKNAGTDVVTDVVFLQKLGPEEKRERDASWLDVNGSITVDGQAMRVNRYYQDNQSHILGRSAMDGSMQNRSEPEYTVHSDGRDIGKAIDELMQTGFKHMAGVLEQSNNSKALAPAMLTQSDLPIGGVMVNDEGKIIRRELNDANGNAVVQELTPETLWKDQAIDWQALHGAVLDVRTAAKAGKLTQDDANEVLALSRFLFKADGTPSEKPNKAVEAVYKLVEELAKPAKFQWNHDASLLLITGALNRKQLGEDGYKSLKGMLDLRNRTLRLIHAEQAGDEKMEEYRADLNKAYDAFVKENGYLSDSKNANLLEGDVGAEAGIEANYTPSVSPAVAKSSGTPVRAASATKSDIMSRRVNFPYKEITHAESAADSLFASISEHGKVDLPYMAKITNKSVQSVIEELTKGENPQLFRDPETGEYQEAERYLSGNVKHKLRMAQERGMEANIKALEKALPADKTKEQVKPNIRGMWMPPEIFTEFLQAIGYQDAKISVIASQGMLQASGDKLVMADFGVQFRHGKRTPMDMFNSQASGKPIIITYTSAGKTYKDEQGTKEVNALAERMGKVFQEWAYADDNRVKRIVESFNQNMNTHTPRTFDGVKYLKPVGASPSVVLRRTQLDGAWRMMQEKTMLADHVVGAGKTFTLITGIMERRRMGLSRKPMVVVPNHLVTQWARDFYKLYPGAKVLAANPADFAKKNRRRLLARIATGDYDAVIVGHTSIGFMETPTEDLKAIVDEKLAGLKEALAEARKNNESKRTLGQIEDRIDRYEQRLKDLAARPTDDIGIDFKALGIDHLSVDEAHEFKNLEYSTSGDRVVGMNDPNGSKKAFDLYSKVRGLLSRGGGVTFATGTPVSNSLVEIYTMMSYLAHDELVLRGQEHFDSWSGAYAATETRLEYTATQKLKPRRVLAGLNNLSALRQLYEQFADIITMSDLKRIYTEEMVAKNLRDGTNLNTEFPVPKVANGKRELITGDITPAQKEYMDYLVARMGQIEANKSDKEYMRIDNALNVLTDARKMSLDIRIVDPSAKRDENGKVATAAKNIKATYDKWDADRGTQLVFCDLSTPAKTAAKEARSIISATIEQLFGKDLAKQVKKQLEGKTFEQQWKMLVEKSEEISENPDTSEEKRDAIAEFMDKIEDPEATMNVADIGFSVYDDLKTVLMDSGIPESEIAFIHDYNTPDQKEKLFDRVNNGYVRVLIGSSMKMGAGTNAQRRLVALHHMDAPWRPSDVEQREGRIIRQGNTFHTEFNEDGSKNPLFKPDFEVEIKAYSTNQTSDTVMWQILQRKAGAIEQFREGGLDSMEEEGGDSDQYAEFMATSTGNPVFRQKLEAERRLTEIESEIGGALIVRSNANSFLESYDRRRKAAKTRQEALESFDASTASYGGESGTQAEFEAAMKVANDDYLAKYAVWTQKNAAADLAIAKWETEPEATRGDKPSKPTMPSQPDLFTKSVQAASGYARAIGMALNEAAIDKNTKVTMTTGSIIVTGSPTAAGPYWTVYANNLGENIALESSGAQKASASPRIIQSLMPFSLGNELNTRAKQYARDIVQLDQGKTEALKGSKLEVDTTARDAARVDLRWFTAQVAFAEVQADIDRGATKNRYIERDKRRNISQNQAKALTEPVHHTIDGVKYTTTGLNANSGYQAIAQATRDSDGVPAFIVGQQDKDKISYAVAVQPAKLRKAEASTNLKQTGAPEANESDVVFSRPAFSRGAQSQANESVERLATGIASHWENAPKVVVAFDMNDPVIPENVRKEDQRQRSGGATGTPEGFYYRGTVYLMSSKLGTPDDIARVLFHEALGHHGLRGLFGKALKPVLNEISMRRRAEVDAKIKQYGLKMGNKLDRFTAAEEVLAELAQTRPEIGIVQRAIAAIRTWLRQNVPGFRNLRLTDAEIIRSYILPARAFVENSARGFDAGRVEPTFSRIDQTETSNFKKWFGDSKVVDADGKPLVMYHGTNADFSVFDDQLSGTATDAGTEGRGFYFSSNPSAASSNAEWVSGFGEKAGANVMPVYLSLQNPYKISKSNAPRNLEGNAKESKKFRDSLIKQGFDGVEYTLMNGDKTYVAFNQTQIKSATGNNGDFDGTNPDIRFSRSIGDTLTSAANSARDVNLPAGYKVGDLFNSVPGKLNWWHKTVGTQYNLAQRSKPFKRVYDAVQTFINDVSYFATEAADMAPNILPKLESWKDLAKSPLSAADTKALSAPVFEGTLIWARDESGKAVKMETLEAKAKTMTPEQKAQRLLRSDHISEQMLKTWKGLPIDQYERLVNDKYEDSMLKAGIVFKDAELTALFGLSDKQIALYREFRKATDKSLANLAIADMLRFGGKDADPVRDVVLESKSVKDAADTLSKYLRSLADLDPDRATVLMDTANKMIDKGEKAQGLMDRGYAPLSRFGSYTLDVVDANGERAYFGMFESAAEASRMRRKMEGLYPGSRITQGTVSEQAYKMFAGVSPETLELFGDMLGLETQGDDAASQAFQEYLKLAKSSRSAMKRLIQRKGIAGFSEDAGRVLAGFVYSNARQTATSLHMGEMTQAAADNDAFRNQGETQDAAVKLVDYIKNPQEEAQKLRGLLFAQYIGGSVASAMVNMTQPITMTFPWLSQYGGVASAAKQMTAAIKDVGKPSTGDTKLDAALRKAEEDGTVSPQEVHQLLKQSQGRSALQSDDGTRAGYAMALAQNTVSRFSLVWGKLFSVAEQFNRRVTFIAAYRTAVAQGMADPDEFARKAISETQGVYNKGNKPAWARGAVGSTLFTFKQYSIAYVEMLSRMAKSGPEGKKAALLALAVLFLLSGAGGMPGADDLDDVISGAMQAMGYNFDSKMKRKEFFVSLLGEGGAQFVERGVSGLPGVPLDVSGRMGLGNLIPGTGLLTKKADHTRDVAEIAGPAGDFVKRGFDAAGKLITGNVAGAVNSIAPKAIQNITQAFDMANMGMYRDTKGMKVLDTDMGDAVVKAIGFQPNDVKRAQDANSEVARMIGLNKIVETEIANRWAIGIFEKDTDKVQAARDDLAEWNRSNPESPIRINFTQIRSRVQKMNQTKAERIAKTAPREIRAAVRKELADAR